MDKDKQYSSKRYVSPPTSAKRLSSQVPLNIIPKFKTPPAMPDRIIVNNNIPVTENGDFTTDP